MDQSLKERLSRDMLDFRAAAAKSVSGEDANPQRPEQNTRALMPLCSDVALATISPFRITALRERLH